METNEMTTVQDARVHQGHNLRRLRRGQGLTQEGLGDRISMCQQQISRYEEQPKIEEEVLRRFAKGLNVPVELIKKMDDEQPLTFNIENNTFSDNTMTGNSVGCNIGEVNTQEDKSFHAVLEQMQKLYESSLELYNQYFKLTEERFAVLEKEIFQKKTE